MCRQGYCRGINSRQLWRNVNSEQGIGEKTHLSLAHRSLVPQQDVVRVGYLAHKLLAKPLSVDGREASIVHLKHRVRVGTGSGMEKAAAAYELAQA